MRSVQTGLGKRQRGEAGQSAASPAEEPELGPTIEKHISPPLPLTSREGRSGEDRGGVEVLEMGEKIAASAPLTLSEGCNDAAKKARNNIIVVPAPLTLNEGCNGTRRKEPSKRGIVTFVSAPLTLREGRVVTQGVEEIKGDKTKVFASQTRSDDNKWRERVKFAEYSSVSPPMSINESSNNTKREQFPALPLTPSEGCSKGQWRESTVASEGGILKLMHRSNEREHEKYCQEAKINKAQLGRLDVQVHINGKTERMQWRAMSYLDHDIILGADFKNLWAVDTQTVEGEWRVHKGSWMPFYREGTSSEADILVECASLAIASAAEQACIKALLDRVLGEHDDSEAESLECAGLSEITPEQEAAIRVVVDRMMTAEPGTLGLTRLTEHHIDVQGASPIKHKMRRMSPPMLQVAHDEVKKMLAEGVIEPSASSWSSAPVIVKKADGSNRFCIDYRDLNKVTKKDAYPVQNIDAILDKLRHARYITTIDLKSAYFQIAMEESSKKYTAFAVPGAGLFQFTRLAFGLTNAPMTFQRLIDALFGPECKPFVFGYLDDIVIVTETFEQHLVWLEKVLERLNSAGLTINRKKCEFCRSSVRYLGYVLDGDGLRVDKDKVAPVMNYPAPTDLKSLRRFLGMLGWYARFIPNDAEMKLPLLKLTKKNAEWIWADEQQQAFEALKKALTEAPVLARPDFARPFIVQCDASAFAIGGVLSQVFDDGEHPIVYVSRVLTSAERNYTTSEKECLALLWTIRKLRPYLEGYKFIAVTDHSALQYLRNLKDPTGRLARWALEMQQWEFEIVHRREKIEGLATVAFKAQLQSTQKFYANEQNEINILVDENLCQLNNSSVSAGGLSIRKFRCMSSCVILNQVRFQFETKMQAYVRREKNDSLEIVPVTDIKNFRKNFKPTEKFKLQVRTEFDCILFGYNCISN
ncbi:unnamed protein product [Trichogramma brassicae]|uniref:Reverse transcriptase domain-containing protein n=1 Tax=Trichogramma brassicae TaxID=86971 RepID=A0A6H5J740_9HYME|nr:unnamed protein product [Trichogramma brassicae]